MLLAVNQTIGIGGNETTIECENMEVHLFSVVMSVHPFVRMHALNKGVTFIGPGHSTA